MTPSLPADPQGEPTELFTGIVQHLGTVLVRRRASCGEELIVDPSGWAHVPSAGESICVSGCCLTFAPSDATSATLRFEVVPQTLRSTTLGSLVEGDRVNLEHAATPSSLLGGHLVQGHVDGVAQVRAILETAGEHRVRLEPPQNLMQFIVPRGSVAVDGVSLTVASADDRTFEVALIPTTIDRTTLGKLVNHSRVNLEVDCIARIVVSRVNQLQGLVR